MIYNLILSLLLLFAGFLVYKISRADFRRKIIPDVYLFPLLLTGLIVSVFFNLICTISESVIAGTFAYALGIIVGKIFEKLKKTGDKNDYPPIGLGDVKLLSVGGIWLGMTGLAIAIIISCVLGFIWGKYKKQKFIPFAPFFFAGSFIALITMLFLI